MTGEDESTDPGMATAEREIVKFLSRDANEATFDCGAARENRGKPAINQSMEHAATAIPVKKKDRRRIGGNDPPRPQPDRRLPEAGCQGDRSTASTRGILC
jgi:hypothetical protein